MKRAAGLVGIGAALTMLMAGCPSEPSSSGAHGTVVKRDDHWIKTNHVFYVTVREDGGHKSRGRVTKKVYNRCTVGERWPDCKKG